MNPIWFILLLVPLIAAVAALYAVRAFNRARTCPAVGKKGEPAVITYPCGCAVYKPNGEQGWGGVVLKSCFEASKYVTKCQDAMQPDRLGAHNRRQSFRMSDIEKTVDTVFPMDHVEHTNS